ncbi:MAG: hypothetical protein MJ090_00500 [Clostridia bacterium]|nr:hypothetical protein [Clostridia bacterium]
MKNNKNFLDNALNLGGGKISREDILKAQKGDTSSLFSSLSAEDRKKVNEALSNKDKLRQVLSGDAAQKLLKLLGGNNNG